jgi:hypothetical protein
MAVDDQNTSITLDSMRALVVADQYSRMRAAPLRCDVLSFAVSIADSETRMHLLAAYLAFAREHYQTDLRINPNDAASNQLQSLACR